MKVEKLQKELFKIEESILSLYDTYYRKQESSIVLEEDLLIDYVDLTTGLYKEAFVKEITKEGIKIKYQGDCDLITFAQIITQNQLNILEIYNDFYSEQE